MRMPPDRDGHGGSQRAWHLIEALRRQGEVHFVLMFRDQDQDCMATSLAPLAGRVASVTRINIPDWQTADAAKLRVIHPRLWDLMRVRSIEAPRFSGVVLRRIAASLPLHVPDLVFAGRLCCAVMLQDLIDRRLLRTPRRLVDFDDIMSNFRLRQAVDAEYRWKGQVVARIDAALIQRSEGRIATTWDATSVCSDEDVAQLRAAYPAAQVSKVPNIAIRHAPDEDSRPRRPDGWFRVLFVGNLSFAPNVAGLIGFVTQAWPLLRQQVPQAVLTVAGFCPKPEIRALAVSAGFELHADVPSLAPFYRETDVTIAPILFGSGTRIKILEAMAFGRTVVSTTVGAEGMGLEHGRHLLIADTMPGFADALSRLAKDPALRQSLAAAAHAYQRAQFGPAAIDDAINAMIRGSRPGQPAPQAGPRGLPPTTIAADMP
jgi:glycosyltransferase involved in cell wall biosynthesis